MRTKGGREVDVLRVLGELGVDVADSSGENALCHCPFHPDAHPSFAVSLETGLWLCYTYPDGCGKGNLAQLAAKLRGTDTRSAELWLEEIGSETGELESVMRLLQPEERGDQRSSLFFYQKGRTHRYIVDRGFTPETLRAWDVGWDAGMRAVVIPVRFRERLFGLVYRFVDQGAEPPYLYTPGLPKSELLFGWDMLPEESEKVIIVEGPLDAMWLYQYGYPAVALLGSRMSDAQAELLAARTRTVVLALDNDDAGRRGTDAALRILGGKVRVKVVELPSGRKDVQECSHLELAVVITEARDAALWRFTKSD